MEIILKIIISMIIINVIYKYIIGNYILIALYSLTIYSFITSNTNFMELTYILFTTTLINYFLEKLKIKNKTIYQIFNINQTEIIHNGIINYKNLNKINLTLDDLLEKLQYENIDEIELCLIDSNKDITIFRNNDKIPTSIIIEGKIKYKNLKTIKKDEDWLNKVLESKNIELNDIF